MTTLDTLTINDAQAAEQEAAATVATLEERVRDGDITITPAELEDARGLSRFARLRKEAAERKAEKARQAAAEQRRTEVVTAARAALAEHSIDDLTGRYRAARDALRVLIEGIEQRNTTIRDVSLKLVGAGIHQSRPDLPEHWKRAVQVYPGGNPVIDDEGVRHAQITAGDVVLRLVHQLAAEAGGLKRPGSRPVEILLRSHINTTPTGRSVIEQD